MSDDDLPAPLNPAHEVVDNVSFEVVEQTSDNEADAALFDDDELVLHDDVEAATPPPNRVMLFFASQGIQCNENDALGFIDTHLASRKLARSSSNNYQSLMNATALFTNPKTGLFDPIHGEKFYDEVHSIPLADYNAKLTVLDDDEDENVSYVRRLLEFHREGSQRQLNPGPMKRIVTSTQLQSAVVDNKSTLPAIVPSKPKVSSPPHLPIQRHGTGQYSIGQPVILPQGIDPIAQRPRVGKNVMTDDRRIYDIIFTPQHVTPRLSMLFSIDGELLPRTVSPHSSHAGYTTNNNNNHLDVSGPANDPLLLSNASWAESVVAGQHRSPSPLIAGSDKNGSGNKRHGQAFKDHKPEPKKPQRKSTVNITDAPPVTPPPPPVSEEQPPSKETKKKSSSGKKSKKDSTAPPAKQEDNVSPKSSPAEPTPPQKKERGKPTATGKNNLKSTPLTARSNKQSPKKSDPKTPPKTLAADKSSPRNSGALTARAPSNPLLVKKGSNVTNSKSAAATEHASPKAAERKGLTKRQLLQLQQQQEEEEEARRARDAQGPPVEFFDGLGNINIALQAKPPGLWRKFGLEEGGKSKIKEEDDEEEEEGSEGESESKNADGKERDELDEESDEEDQSEFGGSTEDGSCSGASGNSPKHRSRSKAGSDAENSAEKTPSPTDVLSPRRKGPNKKPRRRVKKNGSKSSVDKVAPCTPQQAASQPYEIEERRLPRLPNWCRAVSAAQYLSPVRTREGRGTGDGEENEEEGLAGPLELYDHDAPIQVHWDITEQLTVPVTVTTPPLPLDHNVSAVAGVSLVLPPPSAAVAGGPPLITVGRSRRISGASAQSGMMGPNGGGGGGSKDLRRESVAGSTLSIPRTSVTGGKATPLPDVRVTHQTKKDLKKEQELQRKLDQMQREKEFLNLFPDWVANDERIRLPGAPPTTQPVFGAPVNPSHQKTQKNANKKPALRPSR